jgi:phosphohistidine phosphatase SixA
VIYLLRHGDAEDGPGDDAARRLTSKALLRQRDLAAIVAPPR